MSVPGLNVRNTVLKYIDESESLKRLALRVFRIGGSPGTVDYYVLLTVKFCEWMKKPPDEAIKSEENWPSLINSYLDHLIVEENKARGTAVLSVAAVSKWLKVNGVAFNHDLIETPKIWCVERDRIPKKSELKKILSYANLAEKVQVLTAVSSGLRVSSMLKLRLKDVLLDRNIPVVVLSPEMAKDRPDKGFITFLRR